MKFLIKYAKLDGKEYTNHSIRAMCIGSLDSAGFEARHIMAISSHKNETTIRQYSTKCPENKKKEMYQHLADNLLPVPAETVSAPPTSTIEWQELRDITNKNYDKTNVDLPPNFDLVPFDTDDDDLLNQYLDTNDMLLNLTNTTNNQNTTMTRNINNTNTMPIVPKMYFPNSNVTINYNFSKWRIIVLLLVTVTMFQKNYLRVIYNQNIDNLKV